MPFGPKKPSNSLGVWFMALTKRPITAPWYVSPVSRVSSQFDVRMLYTAYERLGFEWMTNPANRDCHLGSNGETPGFLRDWNVGYLFIWHLTRNSTSGHVPALFVITRCCRSVHGTRDLQCFEYPQNGQHDKYKMTMPIFCIGPKNTVVRAFAPWAVNPGSILGHVTF